LHREKEACNSCHENIDPWGIALENYDATGLFRLEAPIRKSPKNKSKQGRSLDPTTVLPNGRQLNGAQDLKHYLIEERRDHFARAVTKRLASYAMGRSLDLGDRESVDQLAAGFKADNFRLRSLIVELVTSDLFLEN
jgi:hypothetical protein